MANSLTREQASALFTRLMSPGSVTYRLATARKPNTAEPFNEERFIETAERLAPVYTTDLAAATELLTSRSASGKKHKGKKVSQHPQRADKGRKAKASR